MQPSKSKRIKEKRNELLNGSFFILELSIVAFPPQVPKEVARNHPPHNRTSRTITRPLISE